MIEKKKSEDLMGGFDDDPPDLMGIDDGPLGLMGIDDGPDLQEMIDQLNEGARESEQSMWDGPDLHQEMIDQLNEGARESEQSMWQPDDDSDSEISMFGPDS